EQKNHYGEKNKAIEKLAMETSIILDSCVHMLRNNEPKLSMFVIKMKAIKSEFETKLPVVLTRTVSDFVQEFMGVKKPGKVKVKNPTSLRPKGREKQKHIKSGREISMKKRNKKLNGCGVYGSTSHNRRTYPRKNDVDVLYPAFVVPGGSDHLVMIWLRNFECSELDGFKDGCHRVCDMRQSLALDYALQVSKTFSILVVVELQLQHSVDRICLVKHSCSSPCTFQLLFQNYLQKLELFCLPMCTCMEDSGDTSG
nr:protein FAR1-related sequence 5 [Tanacetum cinerariifolium]